MKVCYWSIEQLPGLSPQEQKLLQNIGIENTQQLEEKTRTKGDRQTLAIQLQLPNKYVSKWSALADLARVPSVNYQYCGLLLHAGVASVASLAQISPQQLHRQVMRLQVATYRRSNLCPSPDQIKLWIEQARKVSRPTQVY
jgi:hypothetical protein